MDVIRRILGQQPRHTSQPPLTTPETKRAVEAKERELRRRLSMLDGESDLHRRVQ